VSVKVYSDEFQPNYVASFVACMGTCIMTVGIAGFITVLNG